MRSTRTWSTGSTPRPANVPGRRGEQRPKRHRRAVHRPAPRNGAGALSRRRAGLRGPAARRPPARSRALGAGGGPVPVAVRPAAGHRQERGALERIFAMSVGVAAVAFTFWFLIIQGPGPTFAPRN